MSATLGQLAFSLAAHIPQLRQCVRTMQRHGRSVLVPMRAG